MNPRYYDDDEEKRDCHIIERNGNLTLIEDADTGEERYVAPFELEE